MQNEKLVFNPEHAKTWLEEGELDFVMLTENLIKGAEVEVRKQFPRADGKIFRKKMVEYLLSDPFKAEVAKQITEAAAINLHKKLAAEDISGVHSLCCTAIKWTGTFYCYR